MAYDTLLDYLNGSLRHYASPSTVYVAEIKGHPELDEAKWSGRYETFRIKPSARAHFLDWLNFEVGSLRIRGTDSLEQMLDQLVSTAEEVELYELLKEQWAKDRAERLARIKKTRAPRKRRAVA